MLSHDGKELSAIHLHRIRVYQNSITVPAAWQELAPPDSLFVKCISCSDVKPIFHFHQNPTYTLGVREICVECCHLWRRENDGEKSAGIVKHCPKCSQTKPIGEFYHDINSPDGYQRRCRSCASALNSRYVKRMLTQPDEEVLTYRRKQTVQVCMDNGILIPSEDDDADVKQCSKCNEVRLLKEFYANQRSLDKKSSQCILCHRSRRQGAQEEVAYIRRQQTERLLDAHNMSHPGYDIKQCSRCEIVLALNAFGNASRNRDGKEYACKICRRAYQRQARKRS